MKIGLIIEQLRNTGGAYQACYLAQELQNKGHEVTVYTVNNKIEELEPFLIKDLNIKSCNYRNSIGDKPHSSVVGLLFYYFYIFKLTYLLTKLLIVENIDVLNPHEWPMQWPCSIIKIIKKTPVVWVCNDIWHTSDHKIYKEKRLVFKYAHLIFLQWVDKFFTYFIDEIVVLDNRIKNIVDGYYKRHSLIVRSGINLDIFKSAKSKKKARTELNLSNNEFIFLCLQVFYPHRRFEDAILAFKEIIRNKHNDKNIKLYIVGSDRYSKNYASFLNKLIKKESLGEWIVMKTDFLRQEALIDYLSSADVFILPNVEQTWGLIVIEAMALQKACIVSDGAGVHEIIRDGINGFIYRAKNIQELSKQMDKLLTNEILRTNIGKRAQEYINNNFSWNKYATNMEKVFLQLTISR